MNISSRLIWIILLLIIVLPTATGRLLIDLASGFIVFIIGLPLILGGLGWIGWKIVQSQMQICNTCGISFLNQGGQCPACGSIDFQKVSSKKESIEERSVSQASSATIDIEAEEAD